MLGPSFYIVRYPCPEAGKKDGEAPVESLGNGAVGTNGDRKKNGGSTALRDSIETLIRQLEPNEAHCFGGEKHEDVA